MKPTIFWLGLILGSFTLWGWWNQFEFHKTLEGRQEILWSCSRVTGECKELSP